MKCKMLCVSVIVTIGIMLNICCIPVYASDFSEPDVNVVLYGKLMELEDNPVIYNQTAYVPLRSVCERLGASVRWDHKNKTAIIKYKSKLYVPETFIVDNKAMLNAAFLEEVFNCSVKVFDQYNIIAINKLGKTTTIQDLLKILPTYQGYTKEDLEWLAKIVHAEARGEDYASKLAVANVIINRTKSSYYPDTIKAVIFDNKSGVQFTPTVNGAVYNTPSSESYLAAIEALEGKNNANNALFFINPKIAKSSWVSNNREYAFSMGNHNFYY